MGLVDQNSVSWNRVVTWLRHLQGLRASDAEILWQTAFAASVCDADELG